MTRSAMSVGQKNVAKAMAGKGRAIIRRRVAHGASADQQCAGRIKSRGANWKRRADEHRPISFGFADAACQFLVEGLGVEQINSDRQMRAVLLERADG